MGALLIPDYRKPTAFRLVLTKDVCLKMPSGKSLAIQVCLHLDDQNLSRELSGLKNALIQAKISKGAIITLDQEDTLTGIPVIPAWKYLSVITPI
jgi:predicted AAA+ superfamily ATPase